MKSLFFNKNVLTHFAKINPFSQSDKSKLLDAVIFYVPEREPFSQRVGERIKSWFA